MTDATQTELLSPSFAPAPDRTLGPQSWLFGPAVDFLILGGGSAIVLVLAALLLPSGISAPQQAVLVAVLMTLINQPHFAHSYQIFYRNFRAKAFGSEYPRALRLRYLNAGIVVPVLLIGFLAFGVFDAFKERQARVLTYGANLMFFLVGWHYVKQGYGILIVDSVKKRMFLSNTAKTILRLNGYACWLAAWFGLNHTIATAVRYAGLNYYTLPIPTPVYYLAIAAAVATTLAMLTALALQWEKVRTLPWNGVIAYLVTVYLWIVFVRVSPMFLLLVPTFHSLQYMAVVWRYQLNAGASPAAQPSRFQPSAIQRIWPDGTLRRLAVFVVIGTALGFLGFVALPYLLDASVSYDESVYGPSLFVFLFYIFINVHHYFLDNVMWRRGNPDIQKHVFGAS